MAVFGLPGVHEDDALRAVRAAARDADGARRAERRARAELGRRGSSNRTGVNTGEVVAGDAEPGQRLVTGDAVNVAARLEQAAPALARSSSASRPTGSCATPSRSSRSSRSSSRARPSACRPSGCSAMQTAPTRPRRRPTPAGRPRGRARAASPSVRSSAVRRRACLRLVTVLGDAGVGKSRLVDEFLDVGRARGARSCAGAASRTARASRSGRWSRSSASGRGHRRGRPAASAPRAKLAAPRRRPRRSRARRVRGRPQRAPFPVDELFWGVRRLLETLAATRPLVVVFDDIHWAEPTLLDLIEHLAETRRARRCCCSCTARHELLEHAPDVGPAAASGAHRARARSARGDAARDGREPARRRGARRRRPRPDRRGGRGQPAVRRAARLDARRRGHARARRRATGRRPATSASSRSRRRSRRCWPPASTASGREERAVIEPASVDRPRLPAGRRRGAASRSRCGPTSPSISARSSRSSSCARGRALGRRARLPLPPHPHPRRGLQRPPQARRGRTCTSGSSAGPSESTATATARPSSRRSSATTSSRRTRYLAELGPLDAQGVELGRRAAAIACAAAGRRALRPG